MVMGLHTESSPSSHKSGKGYFVEEQQSSMYIGLSSAHNHCCPRGRPRLMELGKEIKCLADEYNTQPDLGIEHMTL